MTTETVAQGAHAQEYLEEKVSEKLSQAPEETPKLQVREIIETKGGYSNVVINIELFRMIVGGPERTKLPYTTQGSTSGKGFRVFDLQKAGITTDEVKLYTHYQRDEGKVLVIMKEENANNYFVEGLSRANRENEEKLDISF